MRRRPVRLRPVPASHTDHGRWGKGTVRPGGVPTEPEWGMRRELMSQSYTTRLNHLWTVP
ncbi:DUF4113 domain-containing protein [Pseudomonas aeruginosa]|uniref:DUF4113 domain-containing protein n=1 Tax=Pseudomonas aeruginosa TaxID=287 RepID=UPI003D2F163D